MKDLEAVPDGRIGERRTSSGKNSKPSFQDRVLGVMETGRGKSGDPGEL
jgi:hypothetical protein